MAACCGIKSRIAALFDDASTADVTFVVGQDKIRFHAHALVMSTASDSFKAMFFGDFKRDRLVEIPDASPDGFRALLKYVYTEEADFTSENVESVMVLSDKYLLTGLFAASIEWIKRNVTADNVLRFLPLTELFSDLGEW
ncbi:BTB/POZ domain-containing protein 6 [Aphelenchoides avenae]|nr:BTB/POZ domain-containing protein 6 [Aphelenchus avenae]